MQNNYWKRIYNYILYIYITMSIISHWLIEIKKKLFNLALSIMACKSDGSDEIQLIADVTSKYNII